MLTLLVTDAALCALDTALRAQRLGSYSLRQTPAFSGLELNRALDVVELPNRSWRRRLDDGVRTRGVERVSSGWGVGERRLALA
jgi:hypothetical protein